MRKGLVRLLHLLVRSATAESGPGRIAPGISGLGAYARQRKVLRLPLLTLFALLLLSVNVSQAQWTKTFQFGSKPRTIYFENQIGFPNVGFVGLHDGSIYRTTDNGQTWSKTGTPANFPVTQIVFADADNGWCSVAGTPSTSGVWLTQDGGQSWRPTSQGGTIVSIAYNPQSNLLFCSNWSGLGAMSSDRGLTWTPGFSPSSMNGITFSGANGVISVLRAGAFMYTMDGGISWSTVGGFGPECWSPVAVGNNTFLAVSEATRMVYRTSDGGRSWQSVYLFMSSFPRGCISGTNAALFIQTTQGFVVSTDLGVNWYSICGPTNDVDTRFYVRGTEIFGGDASGGLWYNPDGRSAGAAYLSLDPAMSLSSARCKVIDTVIRFSYTSNCGSTLIAARLLSGSPAFTLYPGGLPRTITGLDSIHITYSPGAGGSDVGQVELVVTSATRTIDTIINLRGLARSSLGYRLDPLLAVTLPVTCTSRDTVLRIRNTTCDTLRLTGAAPQDPTNFQLVGTQFPIIIPPLDSGQITVRANSRNAGTFSTVLNLHFRSGTTLYSDTTLALSLNVLSTPPPRISTLSLNVLNRCTDLDTLITITNQHCDSIVITQLSLTDTSIFRLGSASGGQFTIPSATTLLLPLHIVPKGRGSYTTVLNLRYQIGSQVIDTAITLALQVRFDLPTTADLSSVRMNLGSLNTPCDSTHQWLRIGNPLCEDLIVQAARWEFPDGQFDLLPKQYPFTIPSNGTDSVGITFRPSRVGGTTVRLRLTIETDGHRHDTLIQISGTGVSRYSDTLLSASLKFDTIRMCEQGVAEALLVNTSCSELIGLRAILNGAEGFTIVSPNFPVTFGSHDTLRVRILLAPNHEGAIRDSITIVLKNPADNTQHYHTVPLIGFISPTLHAVSVSSDKLQLSDVPACTSRDTVVSFKNDGTCDTISITSADLQGYPGVTFVPALQLPMKLGPGEQLTIGLHIQPDPDSQRSVTQVHFTGSYLDTLITLTYNAAPGAHQLSLVNSTLDYSTRPCKPVSHRYTILNDGCDTLRIDSVLLAGLTGQTQFTLTGFGYLPKWLAPQHSQDFDVTYDPDGNGDNTTVLVISARQAGYFKTLKLAGSTKGTVPTARLALEVNDHSMATSEEADHTVAFQVYAQDAIGDSVGLKDASFHLKYNGNLLYRPSITTARGWTLGELKELTNGELSVRLIHDGSALAVRDEIASISFRVAVADTTMTNLSLMDLRFNDSDAAYERCVLSSISAAEDVRFTLTDNCGTDILRGMLQGTPAINFNSIQPNPMDSRIEGGVLLVTASAAAPAAIHIVDDIGREVSVERCTLQHGLNKIPLNVAGLSEGTYVVTVETAVGRQSRHLLIQSR